MQVDVHGSGAPVVLVGGGVTGRLGFEPHVARLASERKVIRVQQLAVQHGLEGRPLPAGYSLRMESEALEEALQGVDLGGAVDVVAWSYGAAIALDHALNHPERIRTLTLIEPPAFWVLEATGRGDAQTAAQKQRMAALNATMREDVTADSLTEFLRQAGLCPPDRDPRSLPQWPVWFEHRRSLRGNDAPLEHVDAASRLGALRAPVLLVKGTGSARFLHAIVDALAATLPDARVIELPGAHAPHLAAPERFLSELAAFQAGDGPRAGAWAVGP